MGVVSQAGGNAGHASKQIDEKKGSPKTVWSGRQVVIGRSLGGAFVVAGLVVAAALSILHLPAAAAVTTVAALFFGKVVYLMYQNPKLSFTQAITAVFQSAIKSIVEKVFGGVQSLAQAMTKDDSEAIERQLHQVQEYIRALENHPNNPVSVEMIEFFHQHSEKGNGFPFQQDGIQFISSYDLLECIDRAIKSSKEDKIFIPIVLASDGQFEQQGHEQCIVGIVVDRLKRKIEYFDPQKGNDLETEKRKILTSSMSMTPMEFINQLKRSLTLKKAKLNHDMPYYYHSHNTPQIIAEDGIVQRHNHNSGIYVYAFFKKRSKGSDFFISRGQLLRESFHDHREAFIEDLRVVERALSAQQSRLSAQRSPNDSDEDE